MMQRTIIFLLITIISIYNVKSQETFHSEQNFLVDNYEYFFHTIEQGQTVYSIATMYNVPLEDIYRLNPGSKEVVKIGELLKIPQESGSYFYHTIQAKETLYAVANLYKMRGEDIIAVNPGLSVETFTIGKVIRIPTNKVTVPIEGGNDYYNQLTTNNLLVPEQEGQELSIIQVALLLPFGLKEGTTPQNAANNRFVEYYEGFLLALNDLKQKGINVHLQTFDTGTNNDKINSLIAGEKLKNIHLLIGGLDEAQINTLSKFSAEHQIPYIIPVTSGSSQPLNNYYAYQINTPQSYLHSKTASAFCKENKDKQVIIYETKATGNKNELVNILKAEMDKNKIPYQTVSSSGALTNALSKTKKNVVVPTDDKRDVLLEMLSGLRPYKESNPNVEISLFGHPIWQTYSSQLAEDFYTFNIGFYTIFYTNPNSAGAKNFHKKYSRWYSRELLNRLPKYGILAYDTGMYFLQLLSKYGTAYDTNINNISYKGIQTDFHFERVNNWSGGMNTNVFFVHFTPEFTIVSESIN